jgi:hypothetical protein
MKIVIAGGGTSGWFTAAYLSKYTDYDITLIESGSIPHIGVGESVTPHVVDFIRKLGIDEQDWMEKTGAIPKLANHFIDWQYKGHSEYFSFTYAYPDSFITDKKEPSTLSDYISDKPLTTDLFLSLVQNGMIDKFDKYFNPQYPYMDKLKHHGDGLVQPHAVSHHIDADKTAAYIKNHCTGVTHVLDDIIAVHDDWVRTENGVYYADWIIDCTGFRRVAISTRTTEKKVYNYPLNSAIVGRTEYKDPAERVNYTQSIAKDMGWVFRVSLRDRMGNGLVYSDECFSDREAREWFRSEFGIEGRIIKWTPERLLYPACGNVVAIGLSNGFVEPLEANNLYMIIKSVYLTESLLRGEIDHAEFNDRMGYAIDDIHDFLLVHYTLCNREGSVWDRFKTRCGKDSAKMVYDKFRDPRNNMIAAYKSETMFPDYMWLQLAIAWGLDLSEWEGKKSSIPLKEVYKHFVMQYNKHSMLADKQRNCYEDV